VPAHIYAPETSGHWCVSWHWLLAWSSVPSVAAAAGLPYMFRTVSPSIIRTILILIPLASSQHNLYDIYLLLCVQCLTPDEGQRNYLKHVEFYSKNKFEKLVHLVGFIIRITITIWTCNTDVTKKEIKWHYYIIYTTC
jgi:hypothetical protein